MRYDLQINEWTDWITDRSFDTEVSAKLFARERYAQNEWRIYDRVNQRIVHEYDPSETLRQVAEADLTRFQRVAEWTESQRLRQSQQLRNVATQRQNNTTLNRLHRVASQNRRQAIINSRRWDFQDDELLCFSETKGDKVNWLQEGF